MDQAETLSPATAADLQQRLAASAAVAVQLAGWLPAAGCEGLAGGLRHLIGGA